VYVYGHRRTGTKTVSPAEEACEKLKAHGREGERFSDAVRRRTDGVVLSNYHRKRALEIADDLE